MLSYIIYKIPQANQDELVKLTSQINQEYLINKTIHYESS